MSTENDIKVLRVDSQAGVNETLDAMLRAIGAPYGFSYAKALGVPANTIKTWRRRDKVPLSALRLLLWIFAALLAIYWELRALRRGPP